MSEPGENPSYTLAEAASLAQVSEEELVGAIKDGLLAARFYQNTGLYHIDAEELRRYLRRTRRDASSGTPARRRVFIIDDDVRYSDSLKLELGRDRRLEVRSATWSKDGIRLLGTFAPEVCLLGYREPDATVSEFAQALKEPRATCLVAAYTSMSLIPARTAEMQSFLSGFGLEMALSSAGGMKAIVKKCLELLGLSSKPGLSGS